MPLVDASPCLKRKQEREEVQAGEYVSIKMEMDLLTWRKLNGQEHYELCGESPSCQ